jgi:hypothetical protein
VTEYSIGVGFFKIPEFQSDVHSNVRVATATLRGNLKEYYAREGKNSRLRLVLPKGQYMPLFFTWQADQLSFDLEPEQPQGPSVADTEAHRRLGRKSVSLPLFSIVVVFVLGFGVWSLYDRDCDTSVTLLNPVYVQTKQSIEMKREHIQRFCRCKDYLVVEPLGLDQQMWIQGRFTNGFQSHMTATFGDRKTPSGTRFKVFVLTTKEILRPGLLSEPTPLLAEASESRAVEVTLDTP